MIWWKPWTKHFSTMPVSVCHSDFDGYFSHLSRKPGETLLSFITNHDEKLRKVEEHGIKIPDEVQGWLLLKKANVTREQRQMIVTQAPKLEKLRVQEKPFSYPWTRPQSCCQSTWPTPWFWTAVSPWCLCCWGWWVRWGWLWWRLWRLLWVRWHGRWSHLWWKLGWRVAVWCRCGVLWGFWCWPQWGGQLWRWGLRWGVCRLSWCKAEVSRLETFFQRFLPSCCPGWPVSNSCWSATSNWPWKGFWWWKAKRQRTWQRQEHGEIPTFSWESCWSSWPCSRLYAMLAFWSPRTPSCQLPQAEAPCSCIESTKPQEATHDWRHGCDTLPEERGLVIFEDEAGRQRVDCTMLDPGASAFLMGSGPFHRYVQHLQDLGYPVDSLKMQRCSRTFHFGGDHSTTSHWIATIPIFVNSVMGFAQAFIIKGETPMLMGRPIIEELGIVVNFKCRTMMFEGDHGDQLPWHARWVPLVAHWGLWPRAHWPATLLWTEPCGCSENWWCSCGGLGFFDLPTGRKCFPVFWGAWTCYQLLAIEKLSQSFGGVLKLRWPPLRMTCTNMFPGAPKPQAQTSFDLGGLCRCLSTCRSSWLSWMSGWVFWLRKLDGFWLGILIGLSFWPSSMKRCPIKFGLHRDVACGARWWTSMRPPLRNSYELQRQRQIHTMILTFISAARFLCVKCVMAVMHPRTTTRCLQLAHPCAFQLARTTRHFWPVPLWSSMQRPRSHLAVGTKNH